MGFLEKNHVHLTGCSHQPCVCVIKDKSEGLKYWKLVHFKFVIIYSTIRQESDNTKHFFQVTLYVSYGL